MLTPWTATLIVEGQPDRTLSPVAEDIALADKPEKDAPLIYRRTLVSDLVLVGGDFDYLRAIDQQGCAKVSLLLAKENYQLTGRVNTKELSFEDSRCSVALQMEERKGYDCLLERADESVDVFGTISPLRHDVHLTAGEIETYSCGLVNEVEFFPSSPSTVDSVCPPPDQNGWIVTLRSITNIQPSPNDGFVLGDVVIRHARLVFTGSEPPGDGWIDIGGGKFAQKPTISVAQQDGSAASGSVVYKAEVYGNTSVIDNCFLLNDIIDHFIEQCSLSGWRSTFLGKDAPEVFDPNLYDADVYAYAYKYFHHLMLAQKSDVKRIDAFQNASRALVSWNDIVQLLAFFNLKYNYSEAENVLIIEHVSGFNRLTGMDLTQMPFAQYLEGLDAYEGKGKELAPRRAFQWMDRSTAAFDGVDIAYDCAGGSEAEDVPAGNFTSNVQFMLGDNSAVDDLGFAIMSTLKQGDEYYLLNTTSALFPALSPINGALSLPNLHVALWRHEANSETGTLNDQPVTFASTVPTRKYDAEMLIAWDDYREDFDPKELIGCVYGDWRVASAVYSDKSCSLILNLEG